ncbi:Ubiquinone biosynthesis protein COQ9, mitochondrial [Lamellibrachia satsuma]|nr:Ubiquinone biosynthesis protein COQ9, mitochondrial [Lamellibrachia satsuma]
MAQLTLPSPTGVGGQRWLSGSQMVYRCTADPRDGTTNSPGVEQTTRNRNTEDDGEERIRERILGSALTFVPQHGWSKNALVAGAEVEGLPSVAHGMFPRGGIELVLYFYAMSNQQLADLLAAENKLTQDGNKQKKSTEVFIRDALETRLRMLIPYLSKWPQAMGLMSLPWNAPEALDNLKTMISDIWFYAGDRSVDMNWYSKRLSVAGVYKSSELYMLQDGSEGFRDTWGFMQRRINNVMKLGDVAAQMQPGNIDGVGTFMTGAIEITRNMMGLNDRNR